MHITEKLKGTIFPIPKHHSAKVYRGRGSKDPWLLYLISRWKWMVTFRLYPV